MTGKQWVTYRMADGSAIYCDYGWVDRVDFFEGAEPPCEVVKETWKLVASETIWLPHPPDEDDR